MTTGSRHPLSAPLHHTGGGGYEGGGGTGNYRSRGGSGGDSGGGTDPCDIEIESVLQSVQVEALRGSKVGTILSVALEMENGSERLCAKHDDKIVGSIVSMFATTIIECIQKGNRYQAEITEIHGHQCRVRIKKA
jgi:hypothetical protein